MNGIETVIRGFQDHVQPLTISLDAIAKVIDKKRNHMYNLFNGVYVLKEEDKEKLNEFFKKYNYDKYIS